MWLQQYDELMRDLEAAKQELSECQQLSEQKLREEREKTSRAAVSGPLSLFSAIRYFVFIYLFIM